MTSARTGSTPTRVIAGASGPEEPNDRPVIQRGILDTIGDGLSGLASGIRDRVLHTVAGFAQRLPGYELLCVVLGRDVVADTPVARNAAAIIRGVLGLIPRGDELRAQLQESGAIDRAGAWFDEQIPQLGLSWDLISGLFRRAWDGLSASDLLDPADAWRRISGIFGPTLARLREFAVAGGRKIMEFVFEGAMAMAGGMGQQVMAVIRRAGTVVDQILHDPIAFGRNLIESVRGGLGQFLTNIGTHLRTGLIGWLTGAIRGAVRIPAEFNLRGVLGMAMEFLGLTWANLRSRIVAVIGERAMGLLERGVDVVRDVVQNGIGALAGRIAQFTSGLVETVIGGIREWVTNSVVGAAITRLLSMFNPAGAVIQAVIAIYNTVQFFIERAQQLGAMASAIFDSIGAIAAGSIGNAKNAVEQALGRTVPVLLGFLARLIGLGDVAAPVRNVMTRVQGVINSGIDRVVGWIAGLARRVGGAVRGGAGPASAGLDARETNDQMRARVERATEAATAVTERIGRSGATADRLRPALAGVKARFRLSELRATAVEGRWQLHAVVNPEKDQLTNARVAGIISTAEIERLATQAQAAYNRARTCYEETFAGRRMVVAMSGDGRHPSYETTGGGSRRQSERGRPGRRDPQDAPPAARFLRTDADMWGELGAAHAPLIRNLARDGQTEYELRPGQNRPSIDTQQRDLFEREGRYLPQPSPNDQSPLGTGRTSLVCAEKQLFRNGGSRAIGISPEPMCADCQVFFRSKALGKQTIVAVDSGGLHIFLPNGSVRSTVGDAEAGPVIVSV